MRSLLAAVLLLIAVPAWANKPAPPALSAEDRAEVDKGSIVLKDDPNDGDAMYAFMEIAAPKDKVWKALNDADLIESSSSTISQCEPYLDQTADGVRAIKLHYVLNVAWSEVTYYISRKHHVDDDYLVWSLDPDKESDIVTADGYYVLEEQADGTTLLVYWAKTVSGRRVPEWIRDMLTGRALKGWLDTVKTTSEAA